MNNPKQKPEPVNKPPELVAEMPALPERFFTVGQESIAILWLHSDRSRPKRKEK